jgi:hypothetical protein
MPTARTLKKRIDIKELNGETSRTVSAGHSAGTSE